jgi:branched-chain amino acid transport system ATP-binding protein
MLQVKDLHAYYGKSHVLHGVSFSAWVRAKSWRCWVAMVQVAPPPPKPSWDWCNAQGRCRSGQRPANRWGASPSKLPTSGLGYVPENRDIFPKLTVHQNLLLGLKGDKPHRPLGLSRTCTTCSHGLRERQHTEAGVLSGGEQQMLTLCRSLMGDPELIIIDEPTEGLAPKIVELGGCSFYVNCATVACRCC